MKKFLSVLCLAVLIQVALPTMSFAHGCGGGPHGHMMPGPAHRIPPPPPHGNYHPVPYPAGISLVYARRGWDYYNNYYPIGYYPTYYNYYPAPTYYSYPAGYIRINL